MQVPNQIKHNMKSEKFKGRKHLFNGKEKMDTFKKEKDGAKFYWQHLFRHLKIGIDFAKIIQEINS